MGVTMKFTLHLQVSVIRWALALFVFLVGVEVLAQTGGVRGKAVDQSGAPVEGAEVLVEYMDGVTREAKSSTNENGDFVQIGLRSGNYRLTLRKKGYETSTKNVRVQLGSPADAGVVVMEKIPEGGISREEAEQLSQAIKEHLEQGIAAVDQENYPAALQAFQKAAEVVPESPEVQYNIGYVYRKMNETDKALASYEKAAELRPDYYDAWVAIGNIHNQNHDFDKALVAFEKAIALDATDTSTLYNYGVVALNGGAIPKAQEAFKKLLELEPAHPKASYQMGMVMVNLGKNREAIPYLEKYLELAPDGEHVMTAKGVLEVLKQS